MPVKYPTLCLVLHNHITKLQIQGQGRIVNNTSDLGLNITANDITRMLTDYAEQQNAAEIIFFQRFYTYSSNIPGTQHYWSSTCMQYKAIFFYQPYIKKIHPSYFTLES